MKVQSRVKWDNEGERELHAEAMRTALLGLIKQGAVSSKAGYDGVQQQCQYRGDEGRKCAVGFMIPDEEYSPLLEKLSVYTLTADLRHEGLPVKALAGLNSIFLRDVQARMHDNLNLKYGAPLSPAQFRSAVLAAASAIVEDWNLDYTTSGIHEARRQHAVLSEMIEVR